jgi:hypothetical protein
MVTGKLGNKNFKPHRNIGHIITERYRNCGYNKSVKKEIFKCESNTIQHTFVADNFNY